MCVHEGYITLCCPPSLRQPLAFLQLQNCFVLLLKFLLLLLNQLLLEDMAIVKMTHANGFCFLAGGSELLIAVRLLGGLNIQGLVRLIVRGVQRDILQGNWQGALCGSSQVGARHTIIALRGRLFPQKGHGSHLREKEKVLELSYLKDCAAEIQLPLVSIVLFNGTTAWHPSQSCLCSWPGYIIGHQSSPWEPLLECAMLLARKSVCVWEG